MINRDCKERLAADVRKLNPTKAFHSKVAKMTCYTGRDQIEASSLQLRGPCQGYDLYFLKAQILNKTRQIT